MTEHKASFVDWSDGIGSAAQAKLGSKRQAAGVSIPEAHCETVGSSWAAIPHAPKLS